MYLERMHVSRIHTGNLLDTRASMYILIRSEYFGSNKVLKFSTVAIFLTRNT
jgi:hypothetical protein